MRSRLQVISVLIAFVVGIVTGILLFSFYTTSERELIQPTPDQTIKEYYENGGPFLVHPVLCPADMPISDGPTWRTITIGQSTLSDISDLYGIWFSRDTQPSWIGGNFAPSFSVLLTAEGEAKWNLSGSASVCLVDGKIMTLYIGVKGNDLELPTGLIDDWIGRYGIPELVTWSDNNWRWRTVVWPQHGIAANVDVAAIDNDPRAALVNDVALFPYARGDDYLSEWPYTVLRRQPPTIINEGYPPAENPFDPEILSAWATEQP